MKPLIDDVADYEEAFRDDRTAHLAKEFKHPRIAWPPVFDLGRFNCVGKYIFDSDYEE